jgi:hypothetical protein
MRYVLAATALALAANAQAGTGSMVVHITAINAFGDGRMVFQFDSDGSACLDTASPKHYWLASGQASVTADGFTNNLATAMTAFSLGKTVSVDFDVSTSNCYIQRIAVSN